MSVEELIVEINIMKQIKHPNIVALFGCNTICEPKLIVMEFAQFGDLENYLKMKFEQV